MSPPVAARVRWLRILCVLLVASGSGAVTSHALAGQDGPSVPGMIRGRMEALRVGLGARADDELLLARGALPAFYEDRAFEPVWVAGGRAGLAVEDLLRSIRRAQRHGLNPEDYHLRALEALAGVDAPTDPELVDLELLASDAFMVLGSHLLNGRVNPETIDPEWLANRRSAEMHVVLARAMADRDVEGTLYELAPQQPRYRSMLGAAERLRDIEASGGWPTVPEGPKLEIGSEGPRVSALRARLRASLDLAPDAGGEPLGEAPFDDALADAVRHFQSRHGLDVDGVVGPATLAAINVPARQRARQIELNLERWRWLPADLGARHIEVNIAGFEIQVVERGRTVRRHRAVVGREYRQTPMFSGTMTYLVLSPYWHVPPSIARIDKLPVIRNDPGYIAAQRMTLLTQSSNEPVDPSTVDWATITGAEFNRLYRLRQDPGPTNALGAVKFMFPNRHNVYLHDTPSRELFERSSRGFSSGCIRIEDPLGLAEYLLADQPGWDRAAIDRAVAEGVERTVRLSAGLPVHLLYWTAWADEDGVMNFRTDLYGRDQTVAGALDASPPGA